MANNKVAIIAPTVLPIPAVHSGGIEQLIENIINQNEVHKKLEITIISAFSPNTKEAESNYNHSKFSNVKYNFLGRCFNFLDRNLISKFKNKPHFHSGLLQIMNIIKNNNFDKIVIFGNDEQIKPISLVTNKNKIIYYQATLMLGKSKDFLLCDKILVGSMHSKKAILNHVKQLDDKDVKLIQSGIDINYFERKNSTLLITRYGLNKEIPIVSYLGRLVASKGAVSLLEAAVKIKDKANFVLVLMGTFGSHFGGKQTIKDKSEEEKIKNLVNQLGNKCIVTGFVSTSELPYFLSSVDIGVVPSIVEDVSPLTYFQYQSMEIPTIVSDAGGIPEFFSPKYSIMVNREPSMVEDLANALLDLINNPIKRSEMNMNLKKDRYQLGIERYYNNFVELVLDQEIES